MFSFTNPTDFSEQKFYVLVMKTARECVYVSVSVSVCKFSLKCIFSSLCFCVLYIIGVWIGVWKHSGHHLPGAEPAARMLLWNGLLLSHDTEVLESCVLKHHSKECWLAETNLWCWAGVHAQCLCAGCMRGLGAEHPEGKQKHKWKASRTPNWFHQSKKDPGQEGTSRGNHRIMLKHVCLEILTLLKWESLNKLQHHKWNKMSLAEASFPLYIIGEDWRWGGSCTCVCRAGGSQHWRHIAA